MLRSSFVPRVFLAPQTVERQPLGSGFPVPPSRRSARRATSDGLVVRHFLRASQWSACRTVGFIDDTPTLLPGTEILWMRLFNQRRDVSIGFMPAKLVAGPHQIAGQYGVAAILKRGTNENTNGLIRQYFPKQYDFKTISSSEVEHVTHKLNLRPRKSLRYKTPFEVFFRMSVALIT